MSTRQRMIEVTADLLQKSQGARVSTRAICEAAGVKAPTLYHHFGDKEGLYDAVAAYGFETYVAAKRSLLPHTDDPVADLLYSWDVHVEFGVAHPALYMLMNGNTRNRTGSPAALEARRVLVGLLAAVDGAGRLAIDLDHATSIVEAAGVGATMQALRDGYDPAVSH